MLTVGVRELKQQASKLLRLVREEGEIIEITNHGEAIARLVPVQAPSAARQELAGWWANLDELTAEISTSWPEDISAEDAVKEGRREL